MQTFLFPVLAGAKKNYVPVFVGMNINARGWHTLFSQIKCLMKLTDQEAKIECNNLCAMSLVFEGSMTHAHCHLLRDMEKINLP